MNESFPFWTRKVLEKQWSLYASFSVSACLLEQPYKIRGEREREWHRMKKWEKCEFKKENICILGL